jgi:hypothetical protein
MRAIEWLKERQPEWYEYFADRRDETVAARSETQNHPQKFLATSLRHSLRLFVKYTTPPPKRRRYLTVKGTR